MEERIHQFNEISRWAPNARFVAWTSRAGDKWGANDRHALGVVEEKVIVKTGETDRMRWEIEHIPAASSPSTMTQGPQHRKLLEDHRETDPGIGGSDVGQGKEIINTGRNVYITIHDLSGGTIHTIKDIEELLSSQDRNVTIFLSPMSTSLSPVPPSLVGLPSSQLSGHGCTGFPTGYFRISSVGTKFPWHLHWGERDSGNAINLFEGKDNENTSFYINLRGELCVRGTQIDVMNNTVVITNSRPPTLPWPNPWSHPLPTFSYSEETKMITVKFYADPMISSRWPRPAEDWNGDDKVFVAVARSPVVARVHDFKEISRWAPSMYSKFARWTGRVGDKWDANIERNLAVVEKAEVETSGNTDRMKWEIELV